MPFFGIFFEFFKTGHKNLLITEETKEVFSLFFPKFCFIFQFPDFSFFRLIFSQFVLTLIKISFFTHTILFMTRYFIKIFQHNFFYLYSIIKIFQKTPFLEKICTLIFIIFLSEENKT